MEKTWHQKYLGYRVPYQNDNVPIMMFRRDNFTSGNDLYDTVEKAVVEFYNLNRPSGAEQVDKLGDWQSIILKGILDDDLYYNKVHKMATTPYEYRGYPKPIIEDAYFIIKRDANRMAFMARLIGKYNYTFKMLPRFSYTITNYASYPNEYTSVQYPNLEIRTDGKLVVFEFFQKGGPYDMKWINYNIQLDALDYQHDEYILKNPFLFRGSEPITYDPAGTIDDAWYLSSFGPHIRQVNLSIASVARMNFETLNTGYIMQPHEVMWNKIVGKGASRLNLSQYKHYRGTLTRIEGSLPPFEGEKYVWILHGIYKLKNGTAVATKMLVLDQYANRVTEEVATTWRPDPEDIAPQPW